MKRTKKNKALTLNKVTVADLGYEMKNVIGGAETDTCQPTQLDTCTDGYICQPGGSSICFTVNVDSDSHCFGVGSAYTEVGC